MKNLSIAIALLFVSIAAFFAGVHVQSNAYEYHLELMKNDKVKIQSVATDSIYIVHFDEIQETIENDNL